MLGVGHEMVVKAKAYYLIIRVINEDGEFIRTVADTKVDSFAVSVDLPDGMQIESPGIVPIYIPGVEAIWTEGEHETTFIWDGKDEKGSAVKPGIYYIEVDQHDNGKRKNRITKVVKVLSNLLKKAG